jgi:hypothetical protein
LQFTHCHPPTLVIYLHSPDAQQGATVCTPLHTCPTVAVHVGATHTPALQVYPDSKQFPLLPQLTVPPQPLSHVPHEYPSDEHVAGLQHAPL